MSAHSDFVSPRVYACLDEMLPQDTTHLIQGPCYQRGSPCQDPAGNQTTRRPPDHRKETQTTVVLTCLSGLAILQDTVKEGRIQATEMMLLQDTTHLIQRPCYQRGNPCQDATGNRTTRRHLTNVKRRKLQRYGHVSRSSGLAKTILQGTVKGGRRQGGQRKR